MGWKTQLSSARSTGGHHAPPPRNSRFYLIILAGLMGILASGPTDASRGEHLRSLDQAADLTLQRVPGSWVYGPKAVWTNGTTSPPLFVPLSEPVESAGLISARLSTDMESNSGDCQIRPALRYSPDGVSWGSPKEIVSAWVSTNGPSYGESYIDLTSLGGTPAKTYVQFGVQTRNGTAGDIQMCLATIRVEPKERL